MQPEHAERGDGVEWSRRTKDEEAVTSHESTLSFSFPASLTALRIIGIFTPEPRTRSSPALCHPHFEDCALSVDKSREGTAYQSNV